MAKNPLSKLYTLLRKYQIILWLGLAVFLFCLLTSLYIYYQFEGHDRENYWFQIAGFLMSVGQAMMGTILIGGGLGGIINFIFEEQQKEDEAVKRRKLLRHEIRERLQTVHDDVQLARILIKSHRSGRTYGEQIRERIMPAEITLQDIKRQLLELDEDNLLEHLPELEVSLTYMAAYLAVLIEEFTNHYLDISNLQNYQDELASRRRMVFTTLLEQNADNASSEKTNVVLLERINDLFQPQDVPDRIRTVWEAMERLDYVWDFIDDLRNDEGNSSQYQDYFLDHHFHCIRILRNKDNAVSSKICRRKDFRDNMKRQETLKKKKKGDQVITKNDSLTRSIMINGLGYKFAEE